MEKVHPGGEMIVMENQMSKKFSLAQPNVSSSDKDRGARVIVGCATVHVFSQRDSIILLHSVVSSVTVTFLAAVLLLTPVQAEETTPACAAKGLKYDDVMSEK